MFWNNKDNGVILPRFLPQLKAMKVNSSHVRQILEWVFVLLALAIIVIYIYISSDYSSIQKVDNTVLSNVLLALINLIAAVYIVYKVGIWSWRSGDKKNQKKIAETAVRHTRANLASIVKLIKIVDGNVDKITDPLSNQYLVEVQNHLEILYNGLKNSEADFYEIVNKEMKVQNVLEYEISGLLQEMRTKTELIAQLEVNDKAKDEEIASIREGLQEITRELSEKMNQLPFGNIYSPTGSSDYIATGYLTPTESFPNPTLSATLVAKGLVTKSSKKKDDK